MIRLEDSEINVLNDIHETLMKHRKKLSSAESCTGGLLAWMFTYLAGSSSYYQGGLSAYANEAKCSLAGVKEETLRVYGAVSEETAIELAKGAMLKLDSDFAVSLTGIAGPGGGSPDKPVGMVWCGMSSKVNRSAVCLNLAGDRQEIRFQAATSALSLLRQFIKDSI